MHITAQDLAHDQLDALLARLERERPATVIIDGHAIRPLTLFCFLARSAGVVRQVIVDERLAGFSVAHLMHEFPHLTVVKA